MPEVTTEDVEVASIAITRDVSLKVRQRTVPDTDITPFLEMSNWSRENGYHLASFFPDKPEVIKALIGALSDHLERQHGTR
jgi:hypothetical protein